MAGADEVAFLRAAVQRAVERSSVRAVAMKSDMSHGAVHEIATGNGRLYGKTINKLRTWYLKEWAAGAEGLTPDVAAYLIEQVLAAVPPGDRRDAALELVGSLEGIYDRNHVPRPAWLAAVRDEYRSGGGSEQRIHARER